MSLPTRVTVPVPGTTSPVQVRVAGVSTLDGAARTWLRRQAATARIVVAEDGYIFGRFQSLSLVKVSQQVRSWTCTTSRLNELFYVWCRAVKDVDTGKGKRRSGVKSRDGFNMGGQGEGVVWIECVSPGWVS